MERSIVAVVDHGQARNSTASYSKSGGSRAKNSLLSLDLGIPFVREAVHCQHFVIRGYVAGMRKKDRNLCQPFASDGNSINVEDQLPPLEVPDFRWWRCQVAQSCQDTNGAASVPEETGVVSKYCNTGLISRSGSPTRSNNDMEIVLSDMQEAPNLDKSEGRIVVESAPANLSMEHDINLSLSTDKNDKCAEVAQMIEIGHRNVEKGEAEIYTSASLHGDENHSSPYNDKRDKNIEIGHKEVNGHENGSDDNDIHETANADCDLARNNSCSEQERCLDDRVAVESNSTVLVDTFVPTPGNQEAADSLPVTDYLICKANISTEACPRKEIDSVNEVPSNGLAGCNALKEASKTNKVITAVKDQLVRHPSLEGSPSSESDGILAGDGHQDQQDDSSGGFPRRKTRKVRLLTDLLGGKENSGNNCCRTESSPSISIPDVPSSSASFSVPLGKAYQHENVGSVVRVPQRKRKIPYDQDRKPMDTNCSSNVGKKARASKGDADSVSKTIEISDSDSEGKVNAVAVYNCYNSHWSGRERSSLGKNKSKLAQVGGQKLTTVTRPELVNKINHAEVGDANKHSSAADTSLSKTKHESLPGRGIETSFRGCMPPPQQREKKPSSSKKKKKNSVLQVQDGQAFARPHINHMLGEGSMKRKDAETMGTGSAVEKRQSEPDACVNIGLDLSLNSSSYIPSQKDGKDYAKDGCGVIPFIPTRKGIFHEDLTRKDGFCAGEPSVSHNSTPGQSTEALLRSVSDKLARRPAMPREQQNYYPLPSSGNFSLLQNLDFSDPCNNEKSRVIQGRPEAVRLNNDQRAEKNVFAKGNSDDIPMDIVELLAKNQHERERSDCQARRDNFKRNANAIAFAKANGNDAIAWLQRECPSTSRRKSPSSNAIINMLNANSKAPTKRSSTIFPDNERNFLNMRQTENRPKSFFEAFSPSQPKVSSGAPFSDSGTLRNRNLLSTEWKNKLTAHVSSPTNLQFFKPFNHSYNGLPQREAGHIWSPSTANHLLYGHNIPQKVPNESSNLGMRAQFAGPDKGKRIADLDLNVVDLNGASLEDQNKNLDLESLKRAPAEYQFLPKNSEMELNPKGMQTSKPFSVDGTNFYEKLLSPCSSHPIIGINGKPDLIEKSLFPQSGLKSGPGESSRPLTSPHGRNNLVGKFCERPPAPPINSFASLFQNVENVKRPPGFTNQMFVRAQEQEKAKGPYSAACSRGGKLAKSNVSPSDDLHRISDFNPGKDKQKGILSAVAPLVFPFPRLRNEDSSKCINLGPRFIQGTVRPTTDRPRTDVCTVNRNPADFSVPETGNEYMISGEDLKVGKKSFSRGKSVLESLNGRKKQRVSKTIPGNEQTQYRTT